jgi:Mg2+ and Co2+ transporter CorA
VRHDLEEHADVLKQGPAAVVHAVCDRVVDVYELVVSDLETDVDEVEASVFSPQRPHVSKRIYELNRELTTLRRAVSPLQDPMQQFAGPPSPTCLPIPTKRSPGSFPRRPGCDPCWAMSPPGGRWPAICWSRRETLPP